MKTKNQTEQPVFELALANAANDDGVSADQHEAVAAIDKQAWSPFEVWRTRVKAPTAHTRSESAPI